MINEERIHTSDQILLIDININGVRFDWLRNMATLKYVKNFI